MDRTMTYQYLLHCDPYLWWKTYHHKKFFGYPKNPTIENYVYKLTDIHKDELPPSYQIMVTKQPWLENDSKQKNAESTNLVEARPSQQLWHRRLGHLSIENMKLLKENEASGIDYDVDLQSPCIPCTEGKQNKQPFPKYSFFKSGKKLDLIHSDVCGPMSVASFGGARYLLTFIDDCTGMIFGYYIKNKDEILPVFKSFKEFVENQTKLKIKKLRTMSRRDYLKRPFREFLKDNKIEHQTAVQYSPYYNSEAGRLNHSILESSRCMLYDAGMNSRYWAEAVNTAIYIKNKSPNKMLDGASPEENWTERKINLSHLRVFGCIAYAKVPEDKRVKGNETDNTRYVFVGYCDETKSYRLVNPCNPIECIKSKDVFFLENQMYKDMLGDIPIDHKI